MAKHIRIGVDSTKKDNKIPVFGTLKTIDIFLILIWLVFLVIMILLKSLGVVTFWLVLLLNGIALGIILLLIIEERKSNLKVWEIILKFIINKPLTLFSTVKSNRISNKGIKRKYFRDLEDDEGILKVRGKHVVAFHIDGKNLKSLSQSDNSNLLNLFNKFISNSSQTLNIVSINEEIDTSKISESYEKRAKLIKNKKIKKELSKNIEDLSELKVNSKRYILLLSFNKRDVEYINNKVKDIKKLLMDEHSFLQSMLDFNETKNILEAISLYDEDLISISDGSNYLKVKRKDNKPKYVSYSYIYNYKKILETGWLSDLFNSNEYDVFIKILKHEDNAIIDDIYKEKRKNDKFIYESHNKLEIENRKEINKLLDKEIKNLSNNSTRPKELGVVIKIEANTRKELWQKWNKLKNESDNSGLELSLLKFEQMDALNYTIPHSRTIKSLASRIYNRTLSSFIASSWPFTNDSVFDETGLIMGGVERGERYSIVNFKDMKNSRINTNMFVLASSGSGKTITTSTIIDRNIKNGDKVFIIDPENEYTKLASYYDGEVINFDSEDNKINVLQVIPDNSTNQIMDHLTFVASFLKNLFDNITDLQLSKVKEYVNALYVKGKITEDKITKSYDKIKWPTFTELKKYADTQISKEDSSIKVQMIELSTYLNEMAIGSYSKLFNCTTNINIEAEIVVFDISRYVENIKVISSLMTIISKFVWGEMNKIYEENKNKKSEEKWSSLVIDEAHLLMNKSNRDSLEWIAQVTKRIRKRNGSVYIIAQNLSDFLGDSEIRHISSKIINNCTYSLIGQLKPNDLSELNSLYKTTGGLTKYEIDYISKAKKFQFILTLGHEKKVYFKNTRPNFLNINPIGWEE